MFYVARKLHFAGGEVRCMQVVQVVGGVVIDVFPFDGERQSMLWVEEAFLCHLPSAMGLKDVLEAGAQPLQGESLYLYSCDCDELSPSLCCLKKLE